MPDPGAPAILAEMPLPLLLWSVRRRTRVCILACLFLAFSAPAAAEAEPSGAVVAATETRAPGEAALLGRLVAPCCWTQTLDVHGGAAPDRLRAEIHARLLAGETPKSIEDDLVARFGKAVLAEPKDSPLPLVTLGLAAVALLAGAWIVVKVRRWVRRGQGDSGGAAETTPPGPAGAKDPWDERLDDELRAMDT